MWSLIFIIICSPGFLSEGKAAYTVSATHVDSFISKKFCEEAGEKIVKEFTQVKVQYACVLEID